MKKWVLQWTLGWAALGLLVPLILTAFDSNFGTIAVALWPTSIGLMGLEGPTPRPKLDIAEVYAMLIALNILVYLIIGLLTAPLAFLVKRRSKVA